MKSHASETRFGTSGSRVGELLEENASLKKGLEFLLGGTFRLAPVELAHSFARLMSNESEEGKMKREKPRRVE
jgi:hypothetical protein